jgi:hypothetical protein
MVMSHLDNFIFLFITQHRSFGAFFSEHALQVVGIVVMSPGLLAQFRECAHTLIDGV